MTWEAITARKRQERDSRLLDLGGKSPIAHHSEGHVINVPASCGLLSEVEAEITALSAGELLNRMSTGRLTAYDVTLAFCKRATIAQQLVNCLTEIRFEEALAEAFQLDETYKNTGRTAGPLHGLPISVKDNIDVHGLDSTVGYTARIGKPSDHDSEIVKLLRSQGAIIFCKTNTPPGTHMAETYNNVFGYTSNPHNRDLTTGGSSGGCASLVAMRGTPISIGTDIGGSVRIPSSACGVYGLKPSFGRFPSWGTTSGLDGLEAVQSNIGPLANDLQALKLWSKAVIDSEPWNFDANVVPLPWRELVLPSKLSFVMDNGIVAPTPPVARALSIVVEALRSAGHEVIPWSPLGYQEAEAFFREFQASDGGVAILNVIKASGEPLPAGMKRYQNAMDILERDGPPTVERLMRTQHARQKYVQKELQHWLDSVKLTSTGRPFDAVISPVTAFSSCPKYTFEHIAYTCIWNVTDQPAGVVPVTTVDPALDAKTVNFTARNEIECRIWDRYDPAGVEYAPVCVQLIGRRLEEEKVLALMELLSQALQS